MMFTKWIINIFTGFIISVLLCACDIKSYSGDGKLTDNGRFSTSRYLLDLGAVELKSVRNSTFNLKVPPKTTFVFGIQVRRIENIADTLDVNQINPTIAISLLDSESQGIINEPSKLSEWTWSSTTEKNGFFIYVRDNFEMYIETDPSEIYTLSLHALETDQSDAGYIARLVAKSGGWKKRNEIIQMESVL